MTTIVIEINSMIVIVVIVVTLKIIIEVASFKIEFMVVSSKIINVKELVAIMIKRGSNEDQKY